MQRCDDHIIGDGIGVGDGWVARRVHHIVIVESALGLDLFAVGDGQITDAVRLEKLLDVLPEVQCVNGPITTQIAAAHHFDARTAAGMVVHELGHIVHAAFVGDPNMAVADIGRVMFADVREGNGWECVEVLVDGGDGVEFVGGSVVEGGRFRERIGLDAGSGCECRMLLFESGFGV